MTFICCLTDTEDENEDNAVYIDDEEDLEDDNEDVEENILPENLEGSNPNLVVLPPKNKRSRLSAPDDFMHLENLLEKTNKQITHIFEAVSRMQESSEKSEMENCGYCGESFDQTEQASQDQDNPEETVPEPVAEAEPENLVSGHDTEPFSDGAQGVDTVIISSEQPDVEAPLVFLQPVDTILVNEPNGIVYPVVIEVEDICANTVSPFVYVPSNLAQSNLCLSVLLLVYLGDPSRNIQIPYSVLKIAKVQLRPDLSAKYIILHLFPEEILVRSNVYGNLDCGLFALDSNRIDALQGLLHVDCKRINASQWY
ncbi:BEN domain-containing protein 2 [Lemmus lemmus]